MSANPAFLEALRAMVAVLESERRGLSALDLEAITAAGAGKAQLCGELESAAPPQLDAECRGLLDAARRLNEINRQTRNLLAANVAARLDALTGTAPVYRARAHSATVNA